MQLWQSLYKGITKACTSSTSVLLTLIIIMARFQTKTREEAAYWACAPQLSLLQLPLVFCYLASNQTVCRQITSHKKLQLPHSTITYKYTALQKSYICKANVKHIKQCEQHIKGYTCSDHTVYTVHGFNLSGIVYIQKPNIVISGLLITTELYIAWI